ncbi:MAG: carbon-nitrogen hydrolase family protein [Ruminococcaceae bacterium]|nr:carbon-nitrogen hydrolase family protein [Oscillospiraceae bacterium]
MKIALASAPVMNKNIEFNLQIMIDSVKACGGKADLILFGESVLQGFDALCWNYETDKHMAVTLTDAPIRRMCEAAKEYAIAVSFGFIQRCDDALYSSQIFIGADGQIVQVFHRVSVGWKEFIKTDAHYREGQSFEKFCYNGKSFAIGLCGDLWTEGRSKEMKSLNADVVLWPVWCDYETNEWNNGIKYEYAEQAALCGSCVLLVNPFCADADTTNVAPGGAAYFRNGGIAAQMPFGNNGILIVSV